MKVDVCKIKSQKEISNKLNYTSIVRKANVETMVYSTIRIIHDRIINTNTTPKELNDYAYALYKLTGIFKSD